ncbi:Uncharacterised protein [Mycobacteroides abscessus subsp. abscessus]|nr:Uncharacterised protein [Mycobacteroides abscessus subsp. abscessus]
MKPTLDTMSQESPSLRDQSLSSMLVIEPSFQAGSVHVR